MAVVVVAHGLWMPGLETAPLRRRLRAAGFDPVLYRYPTVSRSLNDNIEAYLAFVETLGAGEVHRVGYSLGGVISVAAAQRRPDSLQGRIACLGAPLNGSRAGRVLGRLPLAGRLVGRSIAELNEGGQVRPWRGPGELGCVAGALGLGAGRLIARLEGPNDGTVTVAETRLEGITDHIVLPVTHTSMLFDARVAAELVHFLRHGRFAAGSG